MEYVIIPIASLAIALTFTYFFLEMHTAIINERVSKMLKDAHNTPDENNVSDLGVYRKKKKQEMIDQICKFSLEYDPDTHTYIRVEALRDNEIDIIRK
jgi:hypothetical protein